MSLKEKMTALADAVREKAELTDTLTIDEMTAAITDLVVNGVEVDARALTVTPSKSQQNFTSATLGEHVYYNTVTVNAIPAEYITTNDATAVSGDILDGKTAYVNGRKVTGNMTNRGDYKEKINFTSDGSWENRTSGYYKSITLTADIRELEVTPKELFPETFYESGVYYSSVTVKPIPEEYKDTSDADASGGDIFEGKTAYVKGKKITGTLKEAQQASVEANAVTVFPGVVTEGYSVTVEEMADIVADGNTVTVPTGYNGSEKNITVGTAKEAETFTPGTSDITIPADTYLTGNQVIKGDGNLTPENIKKGTAIFGVIGAFSGGGGVNPLWETVSGARKLAAPIPVCGVVQIPTRYSNEIIAYDGTLYCHDEYYKYNGDAHPWSYVWSRGHIDALALAEGALYKLYHEGNYRIKSVPLLQQLSDITQVASLDWGFVLCAYGAVYGCTESKFARIEYRREKDTDPVSYVYEGKILNCVQNYMNFWVIASNGDLVRCDLDKESFDYTDNPKAYAEVDTAAAGNAFVNYFPQQSDGGEDSYSATCEFAFRTDGLWYRKTGTYWDGSKSRYHEWRKANDPGFRKTDWLGYCSTSASENWGWDEETEEEYVEWRISESRVALHIDTKGRLWKLSLSGSIVDNSFTPSGLNIVQVGEDTDWQCVPASVGRNETNLFAQKGGKLLKLTTSDTDSITLSWEEFVIHPSGRMICCSGTDLWFAPEGTAVDLAKAGGTY